MNLIAHRHAVVVDNINVCHAHFLHYCTLLYTAVTVYIHITVYSNI